MEQKKLNDILAPALLKLSETDTEILESLHLQAQHIVNQLIQPAYHQHFIAHLLAIPQGDDFLKQLLKMMKIRRAENAEAIGLQHGKKGIVRQEIHRAVQAAGAIRGHLKAIGCRGRNQRHGTGGEQLHRAVAVGVFPRS